MKLKLNEKHFSLIYIGLAIALGYAAMVLPISPLRIVSSSANSVALYIGTLVSFMYYLYSTGRDPIKEIFDDHNTALAQFLGLFAIGLAIVIHG